MKRYFLMIVIYFIVGWALSYIFHTEPTSEIALLVACGALYAHYTEDKEE